MSCWGTTNRAETSPLLWRIAASANWRLNRCRVPGRIAFKVAFEEDSRMIIDENDADRLNGKGDFLFRDSTGLHRGQVPYISDEDFESLCAR